MSKYTTELRYICESKAGYDESKDETYVDDIILDAIPYIFNDEFPIFDENYRIPLEAKILKHYYTREIGYETFGLWKLKLNTKLEEIMPYYNQLYNSELIKFNPLYDVDLNREHTNQSEGSTNSISNANRTDVNDNKETYNDDENQNSVNERQNKNSDRYSDTPQGSLQNIENNTYLTNARIVDGTENNINSNSNTRTGNRNTKNNNVSTANSDYNDIVKNMNVYVEHVSGKMGGESYSKKLKEFRETFLNIDMMVIRDLNELFIQLW